MEKRSGRPPEDAGGGECGCASLVPRMMCALRLNDETRSMDAYQVLGVPSSSDAAAVRRAYRSMALLHHPDKDPSLKKDPARFAQIAEAFETLSDPRRRSEHDADLASDRTGRTDANEADLACTMQKIIDDEIAGHAGNAGRTRVAPPVASVRVCPTIAEFVAGGTRVMRLSCVKECESCGGTCAACVDDFVRCLCCRGRGTVGSGRVCTTCHGRRGFVMSARRCSACAGEGTFSSDVECVVTIPAGLAPDTRLSSEPRASVVVLASPPPIDVPEAVEGETGCTLTLTRTSSQSCTGPWQYNVSVDVHVPLSDVLCGRARDLHVLGRVVRVLPDRYAPPSRKGTPIDDIPATVLNVHVDFPPARELTTFRGVFRRIFGPRTRRNESAPVPFPASTGHA